MFDPQSTALLQSAPGIPGILPIDLPRLLTDTYTELVVNRLRNANAEQEGASVRRLTEIATSYELIVAVQNDFDGKKAAAFVAGSAYQILSKSQVSSSSEQELPLSRDHIDGRIAAALLFLVAEQYPDAKEAIADLKFEGGNIQQQLQMIVLSIKDIINENYGSILERAEERVGLSDIEGLDTQSRALLYLYDLVLQGIELLASGILGTVRPRTVNQESTTALQLFQSVIQLATQAFTDTPFQGGFISTYPGPTHLASLLSSAAGNLESASILKLPSPAGVDKGIWYDWLRFRAETKPILWPNHKEAFNSHFHYPGNSCVLVLPTGAGKTTLSEFKIAATLGEGKKVVFLAPTNALVEQLKADLAKNIPSSIFGHNEFYEIDLFTTVDDTLSPLEVMTPERCLAILNFNPAAFENVGLLVFDECHSLSSDSGSLRRAIDGMLVILNIQYYVNNVDFLFLSAMLENGDEFAGWITKLTGRECLYINTVWKPSRQARGVLIYPQAELNAVRISAEDAQTKDDQRRRRTHRTLSINPVSAATKQILVTPYALFGLINNWHPDAPEDISLRQLSNLQYKLKGQFGGLRRLEITPNGNEVSRNLAVSCAQAGLKTIVFINNANWTWSSAKSIHDLIGGNIRYNRRESQLWRAIETEFGNPESSMLYNMTNVVPHNANLISFERQLAESLFKRPDGAKVIFATTTLSQGMNLPAQVAILSADERASIDGEQVTQQPLKAHELLNAAGRAGRAGYLANGMVLLVPRTLLAFDNGGPQHQAENILRSIIPESERCVTISDPLQTILDLIQNGAQQSADVEYIFHRLSEGGDVVNLPDITFNRSFAAYQASRDERDEVFNLNVQQFKKSMNGRPLHKDVPNWISQISIQCGISPAILINLDNSIRNMFDQLPTNVVEWTTWLINWLANNIQAGEYCFGRELNPLKTISGNSNIYEQKYGQSLQVLLSGIIPWLSGVPLVQIEERMGGSLTGTRIVCNKAREIATNIAPRALSFFSGLFVQVVKEIAKELDMNIPYSAALECLPAAISKGFDTPEKLAYYQIVNNSYLPRVRVHIEFNERFSDFQFDEHDDYKKVLNKMRELLI